MKKICSILYLLFQTYIFSFALDLELNKWHDFSGNLGNKSFQISFFVLESGNLMGNYCLTSDENKVKFKGKFKGNEITLFVYDGINIVHRITGKIFTDTQDRFEGTWENLLKKDKLIFKTSLLSINSGNADKRYENLMGSDVDAENFVKKVKMAISQNDKNWLGDHIFYPLTTLISGTKPTVIKNKAQFLVQFEKIKNTCSCNMFNNTTNSSEKKADFRIIAINR